MVILIIFLLCALGLFIYLTNKNIDEIERLKEKLHEKENADSSKSKNNQPPKAKKSKANSEKRFCQVIFKENATKCYDYLLGDFDVKVGDFVVVHISDKNSGEVKLRSAKIVYISTPDEISEYAKSKIFKKAKKNKW